VGLDIDELLVVNDEEEIKGNLRLVEGVTSMLKD